MTTQVYFVNFKQQSSIIDPDCGLTDCITALFSHAAAQLQAFFAFVVSLADRTYYLASYANDRWMTEIEAIEALKEAIQEDHKARVVHLLALKNSNGEALVSDLDVGKCLTETNQFDPKRQLEYIKLFIKRSPADEIGYTIIEAANKGKSEAIRLLLDRGGGIPASVALYALINAVDNRDPVSISLLSEQIPVLTDLVPDSALSEEHCLCFQFLQRAESFLDPSDQIASNFLKRGRIGGQLERLERYCEGKSDLLCRALLRKILLQNRILEVSSPQDIPTIVAAPGHKAVGRTDGFHRIEPDSIPESQPTDQSGQLQFDLEIDES